MSKRYKVGIVGLGAIGLQIARTIDQGNVSNFDLVAIATRDEKKAAKNLDCLLYTSPSPRDKRQSRMPSSA